MLPLHLSQIQQLCCFCSIFLSGSEAMAADSVGFLFFAFVLSCVVPCLDQYLTEMWSWIVGSTSRTNLVQKFKVCFFSRPSVVGEKKIAPWSSRWFVEILILLTLILLTLISLSDFAHSDFTHFFVKNSYFLHSTFTTWELIWYTCKWNKFNQMELSHIVSQQYPYNTKIITKYPF